MKTWDVSNRLAVTLIGLALIGVSGAALMTGHATFDQFLGLSGSSGLITAVLHAIGAGPSLTTSGKPVE